MNALSSTNEVPDAAAVRVNGLLSPITFDHDHSRPDAHTAARLCEEYNYSGLWATEQRYDPTIALASATGHPSLHLGTAVTVALARNPMTLAHAAFDLHAYNGGNTTVGIGPQLPVNLKYRFSMPADSRLARMREFVAAVREIWSSWQEERPYHFDGRFYKHTVSNAFFTPPPNPYGLPRIMMAAHGPKMAQLAAEVSDGLVIPPYATDDHIRSVLLPAVYRGLQISGRRRSEFLTVCSPLVATGRTPDELHASLAQNEKLVNLWLGTKRYAEHVQVGGAKRTASSGTTTMLDRDDLHRFVTISSDPGDIGMLLQQRYYGLVDTLLLPVGGDDTVWQPRTLGLDALDPALA